MKHNVKKYECSSKQQINWDRLQTPHFNSLGTLFVQLSVIDPS